MIRFYIPFLLLIVSCSHLKPVIELTNPVELVYVPAGSFLMGDIFFENNDDALPLHTVELDAFYIGKYEVTFDQYDEFATQTGRPLPNDDGYGRGNRSVVQVTWYDANDFCRAFGYRLPTEQEWEYAARSGGKDEIISGTTEEIQIDEFARHKDNSAARSFPGGTKRANGLGIYDMSGNVFEWIGDYYEFYKDDVDSVKWNKLKRSEVRLIRGGSFREQTRTLHTYWRVAVLAFFREYDIGFRCVVSETDYKTSLK